MTVDRTVHLVAGLVVLLSIALAHFGNNPSWLWLTAFVGANLAQSGVTGFCPLAFMLKKAGVKEGTCCS
ncbi:MAG: DUF2892 domain-containing protein [Thiobacillus sp.]|jgi:hypothetical protein|uniref:YgaP family membrane protein n=1 Tax=Thiobacillus sp. TaxID=924 RepID=UPI0028948B4D|nr:DUF2892 domain-containing protein [Thiobacillus sp.]MDT3705475.1 DUF2892 domain-containing protein [Thiobacillus sp.]